jgi:hypothetical protein
MIREFSERLAIISHCPIKVFVASYIPRYFYPYRLQHAEKARPWLKDESLEAIMDSAIGDAAVGNDEVLDRAHDLHADYVIPADTLHDQDATTEAVREFVELYEAHPCRARPLIPLQPPYDRHFEELSEFSHYVLGGMAMAPPWEQLEGIRRFRAAAGYGVYAHGLGLGASLSLIKELREQPRLLDSLDLSTPEKLIRGEKLADKTWKQQPFEYARGERSSSVRAQFASAIALQLNYMLGPFCDDEILDRQWEQSSLVATDGGNSRCLEPDTDQGASDD